MEINAKRAKNGTVNINVSFTPGEVVNAKNDAATHLSQHVSVAGFRPGKAPAAIAENHLRVDKLAEESLSILADRAYTKAVEDNKYAPITKPNVSIPDLKDQREGTASAADTTIEKIWPNMVEKGTSLEITTFTTPDIDLGDWQKIVKSAKVKEGKPEIETAENLDEAKSKGKKTKENDQEAKQDVKSAADTERDVEDAVMEALIDQVKFDLPEELVLGEAEQMLYRQVELVQRLGISYEDYLKTQKKEIADVQKEIKVEAEKTVRARFIISEVAKAAEKEIGADAKVQDVLNHLKKIHIG